MLSRAVLRDVVASRLMIACRRERRGLHGAKASGADSVYILQKKIGRHVVMARSNVPPRGEHLKPPGPGSSVGRAQGS